METRKDTIAPFTSEQSNFWLHWGDLTARVKSQSKFHNDGDIPKYTSIMSEKKTRTRRGA